MITLFLLAVALAMDAFAVALCQGASARPGVAGALRIGAAFGAAQGLMPLGGWALGVAFAGLIEAVDHWIAFGLLAFLGVRMIREGLDSDDEDAAPAEALVGKALLIAAVATSIDAAAAGVTLPALGLPVLLACGVIAAVTAAICFAGTLMGAAIGTRFGKWAEIGGGLVLIGLGVKILAEHLALA